MDQRLLKLNFTTSLSALSDLVMPRVCLVCGRPLTTRERHLCLCCFTDLPLTRFESLEHNPMADKYNAHISATSSAAAPTIAPDFAPGLASAIASDRFEPYQRATALFHYSSDAGYSRIPQALKYKRNFAAGKYFARILGHRMSLSPLYQDVDLVVPVPLHWTRQLKRGYNQAAVIAQTVATELGCRMDPHLLRRSRRTKTQTKVSLDQKTKNVAGAFQLQPHHVLPDVHHILIIDDVFTSGSTLCSCHNALRTHFGPEVRISIATLAFVG